MNMTTDTADIENILKQELNTVKLIDTGIKGDGAISSGCSYDTDRGRVFVKINKTALAHTMFEGEFASLESLHNTNIVNVPRPIKVIDGPGSDSMIVMEFIDPGCRLSKYSATLGDQMARLHLQNAELCKTQKKLENRVHKSGKELEGVSKFGFHVNTCCGNLEMDNTWKDDWPSFYADKLEIQMKWLDREHSDRKARELWYQVLDKFPKFFEGVDIEPALIHGDLWRGNIFETLNGPVIFDPASFYGHSEYDLGIGYLFGEFDSVFYDAYHKVIPKAPGFNARKDLYILYQYINHWNHFGQKYREPSLRALETCVNHLS